MLKYYYVVSCFLEFVYQLRFCAKGLKEHSPFGHTRLLLLIEIKPSPDLKMKKTMNFPALRHSR